MQPRQRSKCSTTVGLRRNVPSRSSPSAGCGRAASPSPRSRGRTSGRSAGRSRSGRRRWCSSRDHARTPAGSKRSLSARWRRRARRVGDAADAVRHVGDPGRGSDDGLVERREDVREIARRERDGGRATDPGARAPRPRPARRPRRRRRAPAPPSSCAATARGRALEQHGDASRVEHVERARLELRARAARARRRPACRSPSTTSVAVASGERVEPSETRAISASRPSEPQTSLPRS